MPILDGTVYRKIQTRRAASIVDRFDGFLDGETTYLAVGDGDCAISAMIRDRCGLDVRGLDVAIDIPHRDTSVQLDRYDGMHMPYEDNSFDVVSAIFVLHHCNDVGQVLSEMMRVARRKIVILEDIYRNKLEHKIVCGMDYLENRMLSNDMNIPLNFRPVPDWEREFLDRGLTLEKSEGFKIFPLLPVRHQVFWLSQPDAQQEIREG